MLLEILLDGLSQVFNDPVGGGFQGLVIDVRNGNKKVVPLCGFGYAPFEEQVFKDEVGGNAPPVHAGPSDGTFLDQGHPLCAQFRQPDGRPFSTRAGSDDKVIRVKVHELRINYLRYRVQ